MLLNRPKNMWRRFTTRPEAMIASLPKAWSGKRKSSMVGCTGPKPYHVQSVAPEPVRLEGFKGVRQAQDQWCWAAAAASIYNFYGAQASPSRLWQPQCVFVRDQERNLDGCLLNPRPGTCIGSQCFNPATSVPEHLNRELKDYDLLECSVTCDGTDKIVDNRVYHGGFDGNEIRTWIDGGRPIGLRVCVSIVDDEPVSHFVIIIGYYPVDADRIIIWDPDIGERHLTQEEFQFIYGPLEQKYLTKQAAAAKYSVVDPKAMPR
jgi:hypothetical protein